MHRVVWFSGLLLLLNGPVAACSQEGGASSPATPPGGTVHHILSTGQSNSVGFAAKDVLPVESTQPNLMFDTGVFTATGCDAEGCTGYAEPRALVPLLEGDRYFDYPVETMSSGLAAGVATNTGVAVLASVHGRSGNSYACLRKGGCSFLTSRGYTSAFEEGLKQVAAARALASARGLGYRVGAVTVVHGESDHYAPSYPLDPTRPGAPPVTTYSEALREWQQDYDASIRELTGQSSIVPLLVSQMSNWNDREDSLIPGAQLDAHVRSGGRVVLVAPTYMLPYAGDCIHFTSHGERRLGEYFAKAYARAIVSGGTWEPVRPLDARAAGSAVVVDFAVPVPPLVLDTTRVSDPGSFGFSVVDTAGAPIPVVNVAITAGSEVTITLARGSASARRVRYAWTATPRTCPGPTTGPRGNLRDSDATVSEHGYDLHNWAVHFDVEVR